MTKNAIAGTYTPYLWADGTRRSWYGYTTDFPLTENPIVEDGGWVRGASEGGSWTDPQTTAGYAWPTMTAFDGTNYIDSIAHRKGFGADHYIKGIVHNASAGSDNVEIELLSRFQITAGNARGYEWDILNDEAQIVLVRWNGPPNSYTVIETVSTNWGDADGDVYEAWAQGSVLTLKRNGVLVLSKDVQAWATANGGDYWSDGQPGMGFWNQTGSSDNKLGWKHWEASDL